MESGYRTLVPSKFARPARFNAINIKFVEKLAGDALGRNRSSRVTAISRARN